MREHKGDLTPVAEFLHKAIDKSEKTQRQLAKEIGFTSPNMLAMVKHATTKFPIERVIPTAKALEVDPGRLMYLVLQQYWPKHMDVIEDVFGLVVSANEKHLIVSVRRLSH